MGGENVRVFVLFEDDSYGIAVESTYAITKEQRIKLVLAPMSREELQERFADVMERVKPSCLFLRGNLEGLSQSRHMKRSGLDGQFERVVEA